MRKLSEIICPKCGYKWRPRVDNPKRCPKCGKWLEASQNKIILAVTKRDVPKPVHT